MKERSIMDGFADVVGQKFDGTAKLGIYCNNCSAITDVKRPSCPECGSTDISYVEVDKV